MSLQQELRDHVPLNVRRERERAGEGGEEEKEKSEMKLVEKQGILAGSGPAKLPPLALK